MAIDRVAFHPAVPRVADLLDFWVEQPATAAELGACGLAVVRPHLDGLRDRFGTREPAELTVAEVLAGYRDDTGGDPDDLAAGAERAVLGLVLDTAAAAGLIAHNPLRDSHDAEPYAAEPPEAGRILQRHAG